MMAPKLSSDAVLGGHHLYVVPRAMTGLIRTTARDPITMFRGDNAEAGRTLGMALRVIRTAIKITGCGFGSQSVQLILLFL
jgi:hypothetical protein